MAEEQLRYPQPWLAMDNGDLIDVTDFNVSTNYGTKQKHTIRQRGAGLSFGVEESTISFNSIISENGFERDYWKDAEQKKIKQIRVKWPGGAIHTYNGGYQSVAGNGPLDDATTVACVFVGRKVRS